VLVGGDGGAHVATCDYVGSDCRGFDSTAVMVLMLWEDSELLWEEVEGSPDSIEEFRGAALRLDLEGKLNWRLGGAFSLPSAMLWTWWHSFEWV
jgi:hypothetical protein